MAREASRPDNPQVGDDDAGRAVLTWELTLPGISDRFWRAQAPGLVRWLVTRLQDGRWHISRYPQSHANPEHIDTVASFDEATRIAEGWARVEQA